MRSIVAIGAILMSSMAFAQPGTALVAEGDRSVERAYRVTSNPRILDTVIPTANVNYPLLQLQYPTDTDMTPITPASVATREQLPKLYSFYAKAGIGTELMPLGELYFDSKRSRKFIYGAHVKHLSSFGNITGYAPAQFDRTKFGVYGGINERRYSLRGDVHYNNQGLHYYGYPSDTLLHADSIAQRYSDFGMSGSFASHIKDSAKLNYQVGMEYNNYLSRKPEGNDLRDWRARENYFAVTSDWWYKHEKHRFAADVNVRYNGYKYGIQGDTLASALDTGIVSNNTIINLHPNITTQLQDDRFKARLGVNIVFDNQYQETKAHIYPDLELKYSMFNDIFIPYVGLTGGIQQNTFRSLTQENAFLSPNIRLDNAHKPIEFYGGIKGTLSKRIGFNLGASFANIRNQAFFVTDTVYSIGNQFTAIYDTMNVTSIEGSMYYQLTEKLKVDAVGRFNSYSALNNSYAWNLPQVEVKLRGMYNLYDKFIFNLDLDLEHGRKALVYEDGPEVTQENGQYIKDLGFIADANLGVEYRYSKRVSAFVQLNNFAAQQYQRWYESPVQAFQVLGGVTFRF